MFTVSFRRLYYVCDKVIVRNLRSKRLESISNPGLQNRIDAFKQDGLKVQDEDAEEFIEQSESDFYNLGHVYNEHLNETLIGKHELRHHIIKEKYFKENMPNLLTWSEKEQIRHLATTQPEEWTPEKIAESFPVTVPVVKKLLKYAWKPTTEQRIARHDASAMRNWKELKEGTLELPEDLRQHFLKFSNRTIPPLSKKSLKIDLTQEEKLGEFERIIQRCASKDEKPENNYDSEDDTENNALIRHQKQTMRKDKERQTLDELAAKIKNRLEKGEDVDLPDKIMFDLVNESQTAVASKASTNEIELPSEDNKKQAVTEYKKDGQIIEAKAYPLRIRIPKKAYKRGATYKVNDCYYDHDGRLLYRVIGMTN